MGVEEGRSRVNLERMINILSERKPLYGGPCPKITIEEVDVRPTGGKGSDQDPDKPEAWEKEIGKAGNGGACIFSDCRAGMSEVLSGQKARKMRWGPELGMWPLCGTTRLANPRQCTVGFFAGANQTRFFVIGLIANREIFACQGLETSRFPSVQCTR